MTAIFKYIGIFVIVIIFGVGTWLGQQAYQGVEYDKTSHEFITTQLPKLAKERWYGSYMRPLAHTAFMQAVSMEKWHEYSTLYYQSLGDLVEFGECDGQAKIYYENGDKSITAYYSCPARFEKGDAMIETTLGLENEKWKILRINLRSEQFLE